MTRADYLDASKGCVCQNRDVQYGPPENSFSVIAQYWDVYNRNRDQSKPISAKDVGILMALFKIGRIQTGSFKADSFIDAIGYLACAGEIADDGNNQIKKETGKWKSYKQFMKRFGDFLKRNREALNPNRP